MTSGSLRSSSTLEEWKEPKSLFAAASIATQDFDPFRNSSTGWPDLERREEFVTFRSLATT